MGEESKARVIASHSHHGPSFPCRRESTARIEWAAVILALRQYPQGGDSEDLQKVQGFGAIQVWVGELVAVNLTYGLAIVASNCPTCCCLM